MLKRTCLPFLFLLLLNGLAAQNWQPVNSNEIFNYRLSNATVISASIWVDSLTVAGGDSLYSLNRIIKRLDNCDSLTGGISCDTCCFTSNGWNFMQLKITLSPNGIAHFQDPGDFYLHTQATLNDTFVFDSLANITAVVTGLDTGRVLGQLDSLKTFFLSSGDSIVLSRTYGLVYMQDYTLTGIEGRDLGELTPTFWDIYDFQVGDLFETEYYDGAGGSPYELISDYYRTKFAVDSIEVSGDTIRAFVSGGNRHTFRVGYASNTLAYPNFQDTILVIDSVDHFANTHVNQLFLLNSQLKDYFFDEEPRLDSSWAGAIYDFTTLSRDATGKVVKSLANIPFSNSLVEFTPGSNLYTPDYGGTFRATLEQTEGLGVTEYDWFNFEMNGYFRLLAYAKSGGDTVGVFTDDSVLLNRENELAEGKVLAYPNPASHQFQLLLEQSVSGRVSLWDLTGRKIGEQAIEGKESVWNVASLPEGLYILRLESSGGRFYGKIQIKH